MSKSSYLTRLGTSYIHEKTKLIGIQEPISNEKFLPIRFSGVDLSIANGLRRIFIAEVATAAFANQHIEIFTNTSQYHREVLIDRIGFIVLDHNQTHNYNDLVFSICDPEDNKKPLKNNTTNVLLVNLHQYLSVWKHSTQEKLKLDEIKKMVPLNMLLLSLNPNEEFQCQMTASLNTKRSAPTSTRWQSSQTMMKFETGLEGQNRPETNKELMAYKGVENRQPLNVILTIESIHKLNSNVVLTRGIEVLKRKLIDFELNVKMIEQSKTVSVIADIDDKNISNLIKLKITGEDHTLGHILEAYCFNKLVELIRPTAYFLDKTKSAHELEQELLLECLSAYRKPHPLDDYIELHVKTPTGHNLVFPDAKDKNLSSLPADTFQKILTDIKDPSVQEILLDVQDPSMRVILLAVNDAKKLCDNLLKEAIAL